MFCTFYVLCSIWNRLELHILMLFYFTHIFLIHKQIQYLIQNSLHSNHAKQTFILARIEIEMKISQSIILKTRSISDVGIQAGAKVL